MVITDRLAICRFLNKPSINNQSSIGNPFFPFPKEQDKKRVNMFVQMAEDNDKNDDYINLTLYQRGPSSISRPIAIRDKSAISNFSLNVSYVFIQIIVNLIGLDSRVGNLNKIYRLISLIFYKFMLDYQNLQIYKIVQISTRNDKLKVLLSQFWLTYGLSRFKLRL